MKRKNTDLSIDTKQVKHQRVEETTPSPDFWPPSPIEYGVNDPVNYWPPTPTTETEDLNNVPSNIDDDKQELLSSDVVVLITQPPPETISNYVRPNDRRFRSQLVDMLPSFINSEGRVFKIGDRIACYKDGLLTAARILDIDEPLIPHVDPALQERVFVHFEGWGSEQAKMVTPLDILPYFQSSPVSIGPLGKDDLKSWQEYRCFYQSDEGRLAREHTAIVFDETMLLHECPCRYRDNKSITHPENPERCIEIMGTFESQGLLRKVKRLRSRMATKEELESCHVGEHVATYFSYKRICMPKIEENSDVKVCEESVTDIADVEKKDSVGKIQKLIEWYPPALKDAMSCGELGICCDTTYNPAGTPNAARMAAGSVIEIVGAVASGKVANGFAIIRPPGHHAERNQAIHGNGTQDMFYDRDDVLYLSLHRWDNGNFYPYSGSPSDLGSGVGLGKNVNITFSSEDDKLDAMGDTEYVAAFKHIVMPIAIQYNPDLVIVSAGFDAAEGHDDFIFLLKFITNQDVYKIGGYKITPRGYAFMTQMLKTLANGKIVLALEGGYVLEPLSASATACLSALLGPELSPLEQYQLIGGLNSVKPNSAAVSSFQKVVATLKPYWKFSEEVMRDDFRFSLPSEWRAVNSLSTRPKRAPKPKRRMPVEG
ncbi:16904_t:CDS:10 [Cetraspora pellucida]|uniref:histone deacetylase n=1 Tax=Cetraspora pellucida TaxID=1433469 RepID=A0A9N9IIN9_9GLOM|nr:16904_t:CDS:10 [Cetraspora pellucida]